MPLDNMLRSFGSDLLDLLVVGFPLLAIALAARVRTATGKPRGRAWFVAVCEAGILLSIAAAAVITLLPSGLPVDGPKEIQWAFFASDLGYAPERTQVIGNLALFAPLGLFVVLRFGRNLGLAVAALAPLAVEVTQHLAVPGRVAALEDVVLGTAGCLAAVVLAVSAEHFLRRRRASASAASSAPEATRQRA